MSIYQSFAQVYDIFMEDIPYDNWVEYIKNIWKKFNLIPKSIVELGCGTGNITNRLALEGYTVLGIDLSLEMLSIASQKAQSLNLKNITYINQDMRNLELLNKSDCILSICDSINYITEESELLDIFKLVFSNLNKNGLFIFDINTTHKFKNILADKNFCETREEIAYTWENYFDKDKMINEFYTNFFIKDKKTNLYHRFEEVHYEKAYEKDFIISTIEKSGLKFLDVYNENTFESPTDTSERIFFVSRK